MGIRLLDIDKFDYPVDIYALDEKGKSRKNTVVFEFKKLDTDELRDRQLADGAQLWADCLVGADGDVEAANRQFSAELVRSGKANMTSTEMADNLLEIVTGWKDVTDSEGQMEFDRDSLIRLIKAYPTAYPAIKAAFNEANSAEGKRKN
jgi:hypothetical protein